MARAPSVILTPTEKKIQSAQLKGQLKDLRTAAAARGKSIKALEKQHNAAIKALLKDDTLDAKLALSLSTKLAKLAPAPKLPDAV